MSFRFSRNEPLPDQVLAITQERILCALTAVQAGDVHEARRRLKQLRALMELVCDKQARKQRTAFRDAGRKLSVARDREVCEATLAKLSELPHPPSKGVLDLARRDLEEHLDDSTLDPAGAEEILENAGQEAANWKPLVDEKRLQKQLAKAYKRCQCALKEAEADRTTVKVHDLRKRLKVLWSHLRLLRECWPKLIKELGRELDKMNDLLGDDHDLVILRERLGPESLAALNPTLDHLSAGYQGTALALAHHFLNEDSKCFAKRVFSKKRLS
jgi:CHAD domain-containing protein